MKKYIAALIILLNNQISTAGTIFNVALSNHTLTVTPVFNPQAPNKLYKHVGVKITNTGYNLGQCTPIDNKFCIFPASTDAPAKLTLSGPSGPVTMIVCLNALGQTATCEYHSVNIPGIIFITPDGYSGNLNGVAGADALCNAQAYMAGSLIAPGRTFKALLLDHNRTPCSNPLNDTLGQCGGKFAKDWPLIPGTVYYQPNGIDVFNTVNEFGVFDGEMIVLQDPSGVASTAQFWSGIQSVHSTIDGLHINGWAFDDMNPPADHSVYAENLASCSNWTSSTPSIHGAVGSAGKYQGNVLGPVAPNLWGNYYYFDDESVNYLFNLFSISAYYTCDGPASLVCVG